jgi:acetyltransferase-like isoleucine patch superfamily enzyme
MIIKLIRGAFNRIIHIIVRFSPGATTLRPFLHKLRGVKIKGKVFIGDDVYLENEFPECVEINDGAQIALRSIIMAHFRGTGNIIIGEKAWIGPGCIIAASTGQRLIIGEGAVLAAGSVVTKDILPFTFVGGAPAKPIASVTIPMTMNVNYNDFKNGLTYFHKKM